MRRWAHTVIGVLAYLLFLKVWCEGLLTSYLLSLFVLIAVAGSLFPDVDLMVMSRFRWFGHRNALTHSAFFPLALSFLTLSLKGEYWFFEVYREILFAFSSGVSSHLLADSLGSGGVKGLGRGRSRYWLALNGLASLPFSTDLLSQFLTVWQVKFM